ncbi:unnamed protein product [Schistosoma turkestanicum]|nr:unnamed protein product [Schistosoma turkestanicum]
MSDKFSINEILKSNCDKHFTPTDINKSEEMTLNMTTVTLSNSNNHDSNFNNNHFSSSSLMMSNNSRFIHSLNSSALKEFTIDSSIKQAFQSITTTTTTTGDDNYENIQQIFNSIQFKRFINILKSFKYPTTGNHFLNEAITRYIKEYNLTNPVIMKYLTHVLFTNNPKDILNQLSKDNIIGNMSLIITSGSELLASKIQ